jgi:hypothetical protein
MSSRPIINCKCTSIGQEKISRQSRRYLHRQLSPGMWLQLRTEEHCAQIQIWKVEAIQSDLLNQQDDIRLMPVEPYNVKKTCPTQCRGGRLSSWDLCEERTRFDLNIHPWKLSGDSDLTNYGRNKWAVMVGNWSNDLVKWFPPGSGPIWYLCGQTEDQAGAGGNRNLRKPKSRR